MPYYALQCRPNCIKHAGFLRVQTCWAGSSWMRQEKVRFQTDKQFLIVLTNILNFVSSRVLKPPGGGSSDIFGTSSADNDNKPINPKKYNSHFSIGDDLAEEVTRKASSIDSNDGASTPSQTSTSNGSPNNSEPNTPRSGKNTKLVRLPHYQNFLAFSPHPPQSQNLKLPQSLY